MTPTTQEIIELIELAVEQVGKLIASGIPHDEALRRVKHLTDDVEQINRDVDAAAVGQSNA